MQQAIRESNSFKFIKIIPTKLAKAQMTENITIIYILVFIPLFFPSKIPKTENAEFVNTRQIKQQFLDIFFPIALAIKNTTKKTDKIMVRKTEQTMHSLLLALMPVQFAMKEHSSLQFPQHRKHEQQISLLGLSPSLADEGQQQQSLSLALKGEYNIIKNKIEPISI